MILYKNPKFLYNQIKFFAKSDKKKFYKLEKAKIIFITHNCSGIPKNQF